MIFNLCIQLFVLFYCSSSKISTDHLRVLGTWVLNNKIASKQLLEKQGVYAVANTTYYTYINTSGEVEIQINRMIQKATYL